MKCCLSLRVPQCLQYLGVLVYGEGLLKRLREGRHLEPGCPEEAEIRGSSIWAVEVTSGTAVINDPGLNMQ